jgi:hypothetical protein
MFIRPTNLDCAAQLTRDTVSCASARRASACARGKGHAPRAQAARARAGSCARWRSWRPRRARWRPTRPRPRPRPATRTRPPPRTGRRWARCGPRSAPRGCCARRSWPAARRARWSCWRATPRCPTPPWARPPGAPFPRASAAAAGRAPGARAAGRAPLLLRAPLRASALPVPSPALQAAGRCA